MFITMQVSSQQQEALDEVVTWLAAGEQPVYRLFGYAGTGKTTLAKTFAEQCGEGDTIFGAYTGKAALVLAQKGCPGAMTIHQMIYKPKDKSRARLVEFQSEYAEVAERVPVDQRRLLELEQEIAAEKKSLKRPMFEVSGSSVLYEKKLLVLDEVSMVGRQMAEDLLSFNVPILALGDPAQLPPVGDGGYFTNCEPDFMLTQVHRQAADSPVLRMATDIRQGRGIALGDYGSGTRVVPKGTLSIQEVAAFDQVIVGKNQTRKVVNRRIRSEVLGRKSHLPEEGDKLVCLRNDHELGLLNGGQWLCLSSRIIDDDTVGLTIRDFGDPEGQTTYVDAHRAVFEDREIAFYERKDAQEFDFGYAMTCHKSQGSQWNRIMVINEGFVFREHAKRWLYTAVTRAAESVTVVNV